MKVLVTGSMGMLGTDLCDILAGDHEVIGADIREDRRPETKDRRPFYGSDIADESNIKEIIEKEAPGIVIHAAAWTDVDGCEENPGKAETINVKGTQNIANAVAGRDTLLVFISTDFVFDGENGEPYTENDHPSPISVYGRTKYRAEEVIKDILSSYVIVRTSWLFGRNGKNFVNAIISKAGSGKKLRVVNDQVGSPTYTKDLSIAVKRILETGARPGRDIFHISNSGQCSWCEFAEKIIAYKRLSGTVIEPITSKELNRPAKRPRFSVLDNGKFNALTGYTMRPWQDALREYIKDECIY